MSSSTSNSEAGRPTRHDRENPREARRARAFVACLALLILATESAFALLSPLDRGRHEVDHRVAAIADIERTPGVILLSDSVSFGVLDLVGTPADVLDLSSNRSVTVAGNAFLVRRVLGELKSKGQATDDLRIVYAIGPESLEAELDSANFLESYFTSVFCRPDEIADVRERLRRPELTQSMQRARQELRWQFPSHLRRGLLTAPLSRALRQLRVRFASDAPPPQHASSAFRAKLAYLGKKSRFEASEVTRLYLEQLWDAARGSGAELILLVPPLPPSLWELWEENGYLRSFRAWMERFREEHPGFVWIESPPWGSSPSQGGDAAFYDGVHFVPAAKRLWGQELKGFLEAH